MMHHKGRLPIQDQIDIISVGTSFLRFLELADALHIPVIVVTDNDGDTKALEEKYADYLGTNAKEHVKICYDSIIDTGDLYIGKNPYNYNTLEVVQKTEITRFCTETGTSTTLGKPLTAKLLCTAIENGSFELSKQSIDNFQKLFDRIATCTT